MDKALGLIGMAKRAGRLCGGADMVEDAVRSGRARLVVIASDAAKNSKKSITDCCVYYKVKYLIYSDKEQLGKAIGADNTAAVSVNDEGLAEAVSNRIAEAITERKG